MVKKKNGRPRTTISKLPKNWKQIAMDCGEAGGGIVEIRVRLGIAETGYRTLMKDSKKFRRTIMRARELSNVWWDTTGRKLATGAEGKAAVWIFNMKNRFGWHDKQSIDLKSTDRSMSPQTLITIDPVEASKQYQDIMGRNG